MRTPVLMLLLFVLTACAAPSQPPPPQKIRDTATPEMAPTPTNIPPTATATMVIYDFSASDPTDKSTWPEEMKAYYENLSKRAEATNQDEKLEFIRQDRVFHEYLMRITINFLDQQGVDMSEFQGEDVDILSVANSNKIVEAFGKWQKATFDETGKEAPLMPADPWLMREMLKIDAPEAGGSVLMPVFGVNTVRKGLMEGSSSFILSTIGENPRIPNSVIIFANYANGMRPFDINLQDKTLSDDYLVYENDYKMFGSTKAIMLISEANSIRHKVDTHRYPFIFKATDGSDVWHDTRSLTLVDLFDRLLSTVVGHQTDRLETLNMIKDQNSNVLFDSLFINGLEVLNGITNGDASFIE